MALPFRIRENFRNGQKVLALEYDQELTTPSGEKRLVPMSREVGALDGNGVTDGLGKCILDLLRQHEAALVRIAELEKVRKK